MSRLPASVVCWFRWHVLRQRGFCLACGARYTHWMGGLECFYTCGGRR